MPRCGLEIFQACLFRLQVCLTAMDLATQTHLKACVSLLGGVSRSVRHPISASVQSNQGAVVSTCWEAVGRRTGWSFSRASTACCTCFHRHDLTGQARTAAWPCLQAASSAEEAEVEAAELHQRFALLQRRIDAAMQVCFHGAPVHWPRVHDARRCMMRAGACTQAAPRRFCFPRAFHLF